MRFTNTQYFWTVIFIQIPNMLNKLLSFLYNFMWKAVFIIQSLLVVFHFNEERGSRVLGLVLYASMILSKVKPKQ